MTSAAHSEVATRIAKARRIVVKIGSSLLFDRKILGLNQAWLAALCRRRRTRSKRAARR